MTMGKSTLPFVVSLPSRDDVSMAEQVGAPCAMPALMAMLEDSAQGHVISAFLPSAAPCLTADRFVLGIDPDPLSLLPFVVQMTGPEPAEVAVAFTLLLDAEYRGRAWGQVIQDLYLTSCPACRRAATVKSYHWQGHPPALDSRHVSCDNCGFDDETTVETVERSAAAEIVPGRALQWEMMARVTSPEHPLRARVEQASGFYTQRSLWVLWQSLRILSDLTLSVDQRRSLQWILLEALWHGSSVASQPDLLWQTTLRRPYRFVERNLWDVLHEAVVHVQSRSGIYPRNLIGRLDAAKMAEPGGVFLTQRWPRELSEYLEPVKTALALFSVPPPLPLYWLLRFVWSGWLFDKSAAAAIQPYVALRPGESETLEHLLGGVVSALTDWLAPEGKLVTQWRWQGDADHSASVLASLPHFTGELSVAASGKQEWVAMAVSLRSHSEATAKYRDLRAVGSAAVLDVIRRRGEPVQGGRLRPHILAAWRRLGDLPPPSVRQSHLDVLLDACTPAKNLVALDGQGEPWESGHEPWWWLEKAPDDWQTASDQAESEVLRLLFESSFPSADAFAWQLSLHLPSHHSPDRPWIDALLASYCLATPDGIVLRPQDDPKLRRAELAALTGALVQVGLAMGFEASDWLEDGLRVVEWQQVGQRGVRYLLTATTALTPHLWHSRAPLPGIQRFLVLPGGRSGLVQWRIDHQPLWANACGGWTFVKFRHLREMLRTEEDNPTRWLAHLGLDPITAAHGEQMRLL